MLLGEGHDLDTNRHDVLHKVVECKLTREMFLQQDNLDDRLIEK